MSYDDILSYINTLYEKKEELNRKEFIKSTELKDFIPVVDDDVARFLKLIIKISKPKKILEIGTSIGYSAVSMAQIIKEYGGKIITIEYDEKAAFQAEENFKKAGLEDYIEIKFGDAREIVPSLNEKFDLIFQDVDKRLYAPLFNNCLNVLNKGGILVAEDTLFPVLELEEKWHYLIEPIKEFNDLVAKSENVYSTILPIGDGVTFCIKK